MTPAPDPLEILEASRLHPSPVLNATGFCVECHRGPMPLTRAQYCSACMLVSGTYPAMTNAGKPNFQRLGGCVLLVRERGDPNVFLAAKTTHQFAEHVEVVRAEDYLAQALKAVMALPKDEIFLFVLATGKSPVDAASIPVSTAGSVLRIAYKRPFSERSLPETVDLVKLAQVLTLPPLTSSRHASLIEAAGSEEEAFSTHWTAKAIIEGVRKKWI